MRVFHDRLISHEDRAWFCEELLSAVADAFGTQGLEAFACHSSPAPTCHNSKPSTPPREPPSVPDDLAVQYDSAVQQEPGVPLVAQTEPSEEEDQSARNSGGTFQNESTEYGDTSSPRYPDETPHNEDELAHVKDESVCDTEESTRHENESARNEEGEGDTAPAQSPKGPGAGEDREPLQGAGPMSPPGPTGTGDRSDSPGTPTSASEGVLEVLGGRDAAGSADTVPGTAGRNGSPRGREDRQGVTGGSETLGPLETVSPLQQLGSIRFCSFLGQVRHALRFVPHHS